MFFDVGITGDGLPPKTLCLTFDDGPGETAGDGPGPRTSEIGADPFERGVAATFFVVGKSIDGLDHVLGRLRDQGHLVANHTFDHPHLLRDVPDAGRLVDQLRLTDERISAHVDCGTVFFRPPYGIWRPPGKMTSAVADLLNRSGRLPGHIGPVMWDMGGFDWTYWRDRRSPADCARDYLAQIEKAGRGIVLMHDSTADIDEIRGRNQTFQMTTQLIPLLKDRGYRFVRLDDVPQVASASAVSYQVTLQVPSGLFVSLPQRGDCQVWADSPSTDGWERFGVVVLGPGKVALRAANGRFLSVPHEVGGAVLANGPVVGESETLDLEDLGENLAALRTAGGCYVGCERRLGGRLTAVPKSRKTHSIFKLVKIP